MRLINRTNHKISRKWLQSVLDYLGVNPLIQIEYADNPIKIKKPNYKQKFGLKYENLDGLAEDNNRVYVFVGSWKDEEFEDFKIEHVMWILLHELRHQFYYYHYGNSNDPWKGLSLNERIKREERACDRFANDFVGVTAKAFRQLIDKDVKTKGNSTPRISKARR